MRLGANNGQYVLSGVCQSFFIPHPDDYYIHILQNSAGYGSDRKSIIPGLQQNAHSLFPS